MKCLELMDCGGGMEVWLCVGVWLCVASLAGSQVNEYNGLVPEPECYFAFQVLIWDQLVSSPGPGQLCGALF